MVVSIKVKKIWCFLVLYLGEPQTTWNCIKFLKSPKSTHPTVYTLHKTLCTQQLVPHAADRCAVILFPAFWGNNPWNKDEGRLLFILYWYIFFVYNQLKCTTQNKCTKKVQPKAKYVQPQKSVQLTQIIYNQKKYVQCTPPSKKKYVQPWFPLLFRFWIEWTSPTTITTCSFSQQTNIRNISMQWQHGWTRVPYCAVQSVH